MDLILNAPTWLLVMLALVAVAVLFSGLRRGQANVRTAGLILIGLAALLLALRLVVPTDEKRVEKSARDLLAAIGKQDWETTGRLLKHAQMMSWQGDELTHRTQFYAKQFGLKDLKVNSIDVKKEPLIITARVSVTTYHNLQYVDTVPSTWNFEYQKRLEGWVLTKIVPLKIGTLDQSAAEDQILK